MEGYRRYLAETPETAMTPEAMRRLADLQVEKQFGIRAGDGKPREMAAPERAQESVAAQAGPKGAGTAAASAGPAESERSSSVERPQRTSSRRAVTPVRRPCGHAG